MNWNTILALMILLAVMIGAWVLLRKSRKTSEYDEMQLKIRARGYRIGFYTALILLAALILFSEMNLLTLVTPGFAAGAVLMVTVVVFAVYCIVHDAFVDFRGNAKSQIGIYTAIVILDGITTIRYLVSGELPANGKLTFGNGSPALMFAGFLVILVTLIVKTLRNRKEAEE